MKHIIALSVLIVFSFGVKSQSILPHDTEGKISFTEKVRVDSSDADELYRRAKTWMLENFRNLKQIVQKDDNVNHEIILRGTGECYAEHSFGDTIENAGNSYTLTIEIDNGGFKYTMNDFKTMDKWKGDLPSESFKGGKKQMQLHEQSILDLVATLTKSLKQSMSLKIVIGLE